MDLHTISKSVNPYCRNVLRNNFCFATEYLSQFYNEDKYFVLKSFITCLTQQDNAHIVLTSFVACYPISIFLWHPFLVSHFS